MSETLLERCAFLAASAAGNPTHYMMEQAIGQAELDWRFLTFEVDDDHLPQALDGLDVLGFRGVMLAAEFRTAAVERLAALTPRAEQAGSVNCLVRQDGKLIGDNTFGAAFVEALNGSNQLAGRGVLVIGHGRVARSVAAAASSTGTSGVHIASHDEDLLAALVEQLATNSEQACITTVPVDNNMVRTPADVGVVVFAPDNDEETSRPIIDTSAVEGKLTIVDTRMRGSRTGLVKYASEQGADIIDGVELFARETALALELWTGITFDRAPLQELAEEFLGV